MDPLSRFVLVPIFLSFLISHHIPSLFFSFLSVRQKNITSKIIHQYLALGNTLCLQLEPARYLYFSLTYVPHCESQLLCHFSSNILVNIQYVCEKKERKLERKELKTIASLNIHHQRQSVGRSADWYLKPNLHICGTNTIFMSCQFIPRRSISINCVFK